MMAWDEALARCERELDIQRAARDAAEAERDEAIREHNYRVDVMRERHYTEIRGALAERDRLAAALRELREAILGFPLGGDEPRRVRVRDACMAAEAALSVLDRGAPDLTL